MGVGASIAAHDLMQLVDCAFLAEFLDKSIVYQLVDVDIEDARNPVQDIDTRRVNASLKRADVGAVDFGTMREFFLRDASRRPKLPQIERQYLSDIHARERSDLKSI